MSKVSVALTTYHGAEYIIKQMQSLLRQTRQADEVIICDDCSQDHTTAIIRQFIADHKLENWHLFENQTNMGFAKNFQKALSITSGEIIFLCDQDDIWLDSKIEIMAGIMENQPNISALACSYRLIDSNDFEISAGKKFYEPAPGTPTLSAVEYGPVLYYNIAQGCAGAYRKNLIDAFCAVDDFGAIPHDWALNLMAHQEHGLYFFNEALLLYRIHGNNAIGIDSQTAAVSDRIHRLQKYSSELKSALCLPLSAFSKKEICSIVAFTNTRISWLRKKQLSIWLNGLRQHAYVLKQYFFWQYLKDLALVAVGKIP